MDLHCILCIANSSYADKTPKDEVTCDAYWNFYKKLKIWTCFRQNGRFRDQTVGRKTSPSKREFPFQNGRVGTYVWCSIAGTKQLLTYALTFESIYTSIGNLGITNKK